MTNFNKNNGNVFKGGTMVVTTEEVRVRDRDNRDIVKMIIPAGARGIVGPMLGSGKYEVTIWVNGRKVFVPVRSDQMKVAVLDVEAVSAPDATAA